MKLCLPLWNMKSISAGLVVAMTFPCSVLYVHLTDQFLRHNMHSRYLWEQSQIVFVLILHIMLIDEVETVIPLYAWSLSLRFDVRLSSRLDSFGIVCKAPPPTLLYEETKGSALTDEH